MAKVPNLKYASGLFVKKVFAEIKLFIEPYKEHGGI